MRFKIRICRILVSLRFDCLLLYCYDILFCLYKSYVTNGIPKKVHVKRKYLYFSSCGNRIYESGLIIISVSVLLHSSLLFFPHFVILMQILQQLYNCTSNSFIKSVYFFLSMHLRDYILKRLAKYNLKISIFIEIRVKFSVNNYKILNLFFIPSFSFF